MVRTVLHRIQGQWLLPEEIHGKVSFMLQNVCCSQQFNIKSRINLRKKIERFNAILDTDQEVIIAQQEWKMKWKLNTNWLCIKTFVYHLKNNL